MSKKTNPNIGSKGLRPVHIALASSDNFTPYLSVTIQSVIANANKERKYNIYILHTNITDENIAAIKKMQTENVSIRFFNISKSLSSIKLYSHNHISEETYFRALLPKLLSNINKVVYIDCDLVVLKDIGELYDINIEKYLLGAVKNCCNEFVANYIQNDIHIQPDEYFNAGVLLINLKMFRELDIPHKFFEIATGEKKFIMMDQDILNILCNKKILYLDNRWNVVWQFLFKRERPYSLLPEYKDEYARATSDPFIVHYTTEKKPWEYKTAPFANYFWDFAKTNELFLNENGKKRALLVTHEMDYAGSEHSLRRVCLVLKEAGYRVDVWSYQEGDYAAEFKKIGIRVKVVNKSRVGTDEYTELYKLYDLVIANTIFTYAIVKAAQDIVPTIWYIREAQNIPNLFGSSKDMYEMMYKAYCIYAVSEYAGDFISHNYNPNVHVLHNCVDDEYDIYGSAHKPLLKGGKVKILTMGTIEERKGYDVYFHAYIALPDEYKEKCELHFCGRTALWAEKYSKELFEEIEPYNNIIYHGEIQDRKILLELVDSMDVIAVTSRDESCSLVALEGAMMRKPLLLTENVGAKYLVNDSNGWIVKTGDIDSLKQAYIDIIDNAEKLCEMGENARIEYEKTSTFSAFAPKIRDMAENTVFSSDSEFAAYKERCRRNLISIDEKNYPMSLITYDIFDTVLTRVTATSKGIFALMQHYLVSSSKYDNKSHYLRENFYNLRVNAEAYARNALIDKNKKEITLDDIYSALGMTGEASPSSLLEIKALEENTEYNASLGIEENIQKIIGSLNKKHRLVFVSDMYLNKEFVRRLLYKANPMLSKQQIYISSQSNAAKWSGDLFRKVKNDRKIAFADWKHIGDNALSDYDAARKLGIKAELYKGSELLPWEKRLIESDESDPYMQLAVGASKNARSNSSNSTLAFKVGASVGGMLIYTYVRLMLQTSKNRGIKRLYFIARDGYLLKKVADVIIEKYGYEISTHYIYGSRQAWRIPALNADKSIYNALFKESLFHFTTNIDDFADIFQIECRELFEFIPCIYRKEHTVLSRSDVEKIKEALINNAKFTEFLCQKHKNKYDNTIAYLEQEIDVSDEHFAFVELNGSGFTQYCLQALMESFYNGSITTFYFKLSSLKKYDNAKVRFINYLPNNLKAAHIIEAFCRAPHGQTMEYRSENGEMVPVLDTNEGSAIIDYGFNDYAEGVVKFSECLAAAELAVHIPVTSCSVPVKCLKYLTTAPEKELLDFICDMPFGATGREKEAVSFAPKLTDEQIKNIYGKHSDLHSVYNGASLDMSLLRCTENQLKLKADCEKRAASNEEKNREHKKKFGAVGKNHLAQGDMSQLQLHGERKYPVSRSNDYSECFYVKDAENLIKKGEYVAVYRGAKKGTVLSASLVTRVNKDAVYYSGKKIKTVAGDIVAVVSRFAKDSSEMIADNWHLLSLGNVGINVKMKSGIRVSKPYTDHKVLLRSGFILPIPEELKGQYITLSIKFENRKNNPEMLFATSKEQMDLSAVGLLDEKKLIVSDEYEALTSFIPEDHKYMRIMIQCPGNEEKGLLLQKIKLETGLESTIENERDRIRGVGEIFSASKISGAFICLKANGFKYTMKRIKAHLTGRE